MGTHRGLMPYVELADTYPVILYDQLGNGMSAKFVDDINDQSTWNVEHFVKEISQIREALNLKEVIIAGHS
ncbi:MAG: alpha/beta fold hydrolase, partial [Emcibacteraceae bacterium]|nr:alpha/beta fold hydrolase [Emcibacteraceae bacterium]